MDRHRTRPFEPDRRPAPGTDSRRDTSVGAAGTLGNAVTVTGAPLASDRWTRLLVRILSRARCGRMDIVAPDGSRHVMQGDRPGPAAALRFATPAAVKSLLTRGDIGFAESYMAGAWTTPDLAAVVEYAALNVRAIERALTGTWWARLLLRLFHLRRANTRAGSKRNIVYHYDLGNAFYERWLDPTMTYSSAVFEHDDQPLSDAQRHKYRLIGEQLDLKPGHHVLEIGCGWGGFATFAAREFGCRVTGITLSPSQLDAARRRARAMGLDDLVEFRLVDYRDVGGTYDAVASIEMFEAVGEENWPVYFSTVRDRLRPGGRAALQIITIADELYTQYRARTDFIQRYIFPGGMLPSPQILRRQVEQAGLVLTRSASYGLHYAKTLAAWGERFRAAWDDIQPLGFDDRFRRLWEFYLAYCEGGFRARNIDVVQVRLERA